MGKLIPDTSVVTFYRRSLAPADSEISNEGLNPAPALDTKEIDIDEGQWVTLDAAGKAVKVGGTATRLAFAVWVGRRSDAGAALQITAIFGVYIASTSVFNPSPAGGAYVAGDLLTAKSARLDRAATGEPIVAVAEGPVFGATTEFPDGFLKYNTAMIGGFAP